MPTKESTHTNKESLKRQSSQPAIESSNPVAQQQSHRAENINRAKTHSGMLAHPDILQLQRMIGNRAVGRLLSGGYQRQKAETKNSVGDATVIQRYEEKKLTVSGNSSPSSFLFDKRVEEGDAKTGVHNYAVVLGSWKWAKSTTNRHAEIKLLLGLQPKAGDQIMILSEFKPCGGCRKDMQEYEQTHGVTIKVFYLLDYEAAGDGDKDMIREFYKGLGKLSGGGLYTYQIV